MIESTLSMLCTLQCGGADLSSAAPPNAPRLWRASARRWRAGRRRRRRRRPSAWRLGRWTRPGVRRAPFRRPPGRPAWWYGWLLQERWRRRRLSRARRRLSWQRRLWTRARWMRLVRSWWRSRPPVDRRIRSSAAEEPVGLRWFRRGAHRRHLLDFLDPGAIRRRGRAIGQRAKHGEGGCCTLGCRRCRGRGICGGGAGRRRGGW